MGDFQNPVMSINWFPVWEDPDLLKYVRYSLYKTSIKSLREGIKINFKVVEYTTEIEEESMPELPLTSVMELMKKFETTTPNDFMLSAAREGFIPKIVKIENPIAIMGDALSDYRTQVEQIKKYYPEKAIELESILNDLERMKTVDKNSDSKLQRLHADSYNLIQSNPELQRDVIFEIGKNRTPSFKNFLGKNYCLLMSHYGKMNFDDDKNSADGGVMLPILIPEDAFRSLPYGQMFMGRILGVVYFNPQPIFKNLGPGPVLVAAAISVGMKADILQKQ